LRNNRLFLAFVLLGISTLALAQEYERAPINYSSATPQNVVSELEGKVVAGTSQVDFDVRGGYLRSLLQALGVPESSQVLVFSKTSMQRQRIGPESPRAIYFNDDVMVGFTLRGQVIEISAADDRLGAAYYTLDQSPEEKPNFQRQTESCLLCHGSSVNQGFPGHLARSLIVDRTGSPLPGSPTYQIDHTSPLDRRWGGWYVTGQSGRQMHLGNLIGERSKRLKANDNRDGVNLLSLKGRFDAGSYLSPHSDIVALMVLEHQVGMLNRLARAALESRLLLHDVADRKQPLREAQARIDQLAEEVVQYMLYQDEAELTDPIKGTSAFAKDFSARGPRDSKGRSLRDLDLKTRLFKYPCSYLIHSRAFDSLPEKIKTSIYGVLWKELSGRGTLRGESALSERDRNAIREILLATKRDLPAYWKPAR